MCVYVYLCACMKKSYEKLIKERRKFGENILQMDILQFIIH